MHFVLFTYYQLLKLILYFQFILNAFTNIVLLLNHIYLFVYVLVYSELIYWFIEWLLVGPYIGLELLQINSNPSKHKWHRRMWIFPTCHYHNSASCWCEFVTDEGSHFTDSGRGSRRRVALSDAVEWLMEPFEGWAGLVTGNNTCWRASASEGCECACQFGLIFICAIESIFIYAIYH